MNGWNDVVHDLTSVIRPQFTADRWKHTLGVLETATTIAVKFPELQCDTVQVALAALLHDVAKDMSGQDLVARIRENDIPVDVVDLGFPAILHGPVGAWLAQNRYHIQDAVVLDAITHHTVGKPHPSTVLQVLMIADMVEPGRDYPGVEELRALAFRDPRQALEACIERKLDHILRKGRTPHPRATAMLETLKGRTVPTS